MTTFTNLDSEVVFPVVGKRLVELAVLFLRDVVWVTCPDRLRLVQLLVLRETNQQSQCQKKSFPEPHEPTGWLGSQAATSLT